MVSWYSSNFSTVKSQHCNIAIMRWCLHRIANTKYRTFDKEKKKAFRYPIPTLTKAAIWDPSDGLRHLPGCLYTPRYMSFIWAQCGECRSMPSLRSACLKLEIVLTFPLSVEVLCAHIVTDAILTIKVSLISCKIQFPATLYFIRIFEKPTVFEL